MSSCRTNTHSWSVLRSDCYGFFHCCSAAAAQSGNAGFLKKTCVVFCSGGSGMNTATLWRAPSSDWRRNNRGVSGSITHLYTTLYSPWSSWPPSSWRMCCSIPSLVVTESCHLHLKQHVCLSRSRSVGLADTNALLREQLSQSEQGNQALRDDLHKLTSDWTRAVEEAEQREDDWQREREVSVWFNVLTEPPLA